MTAPDLRRPLPRDHTVHLTLEQLLDVRNAVWRERCEKIKVLEWATLATLRETYTARVAELDALLDALS